MIFTILFSLIWYGKRQNSDSIFGEYLKKGGFSP
jgi:hypothetical protein